MTLQSLLDIMFCMGWYLSSQTVWGTGWWRTSRNFCGWIAASTIQSVAVTLAGPHPSAWWQIRVWIPIEVVVLVLLGFAVVDAMVLCRAATLLGAAIAAVPIMWMAVPSTGGWYSAFLQFREWLMVAAALAMTVHVAQLMLHPKALPPAVYRSRCIWAILLIALATTGPIARSYDSTWVTARGLYRGIATLCCMRWWMLGPRMRQAVHE